MSGVVEFSVPCGCWTYLCSWGCFGLDFEGEQEARDALLSHKCEMTS